MDTIKTNQIEIGGKLLDIEPKKLNGNVQINLTGDVSGSIDTPIEAGKTITIETRVEGGTGGGIPEAPIDDKQYARKNAGWVEVEGGGADNTFVVTPGAIAALTATPTPFTDIKAAFQASKVIQAHAIVNGEGVYGYLQAFQFNSTTNKGSAIFAFYNSNPNYLNGTDFIITCSYDASASPTDTWEQSVQMPIPAPAASDANKVLKANSSGNAVGWDKVKSSELTNDYGFSKVVVGNAPPAAGTPDDTITLILGGAGGAGEYGAWEEICDKTFSSSSDVATFSKSIRDFDFILFQGVAISGGETFYVSNLVNVSIIQSNHIVILGDKNNVSSFRITSDTSLSVFYLSNVWNNVKVYGINLKGSKKDVIEEFSMIRKVDTDLLCSANHKIEIDFYMDASVISSINAGVMLSSTRTSESTVKAPDFCLYQGRLYFTLSGTSENNVSISDGWHSLIANDESGKTTLDGTTISSSAYSPDDSKYYILNCRGTQSYFPNILPYKKIKITDKSTSQVVLDVECFDKDGLRYIVDKYHHIDAILR